MPGSYARALQKANTLPADALIFDLEDAVAPDAKPLARDLVCAAVAEGGYGGREVVIRVNALETPWGMDDLKASCAAGPDAILVPKVVHSGDIISAVKILQSLHAAKTIRLWAIMETPMAIVNARTIAATAVYKENRLDCLVMGTNDLLKESRARALHDRFAIVPWLAVTIVAARAYRLDILDGFITTSTMRPACALNASMAAPPAWTARHSFIRARLRLATMSSRQPMREIVWARKVIDAFGQPENAAKGVIVVEGRMVERLHFAMAQRTVAIAERIDAMHQALPATVPSHIRALA